MKFWKHIAIILLALNIGTSAAFAHSKMAESIPPDGGTAQAGLETLQLSFQKPVRVMLVKVKRIDEAADIPVLKKGIVGFSKTYRVVVPPLAAGAYEVTWTSVAKDGHVMKGTLTFTLKDLSRS